MSEQYNEKEVNDAISRLKSSVMNYSMYQHIRSDLMMLIEAFETKLVIIEELRGIIKSGPVFGACNITSAPYVVDEASGIEENKWWRPMPCSDAVSECMKSDEEHKDE